MVPHRVRKQAVFVSINSLPSKAY